MESKVPAARGVLVICCPWQKRARNRARKAGVADVKAMQILGCTECHRKKTYVFTSLLSGYW